MEITDADIRPADVYTWPEGDDKASASLKI